MNDFHDRPAAAALDKVWAWFAPDGRPGTRFLASAAGLLGFVWLLYWIFEGSLLSLAARDRQFTGGVVQFDLATVRHTFRTFLVVLTVTAAAGAACIWAGARASSSTLWVLFSLSFTSLCTAVILRTLMTAGYEADWYPLETILGSPQDLPIFGRRLLFVWPAKALTALHPAFTPYRAFLATQAAVAWLTCLSVKAFCGRFGGRLYTLAGEAVFALLIVGVIDYFNGYDIGIAMFFALGLSAALGGRWLLFALLVGAGTLNHENILLLIPTAVFVRFGAEPNRRLALGAAAALAAHIAARLAIAWAVPAPGLLDLRIWTNARSLIEPSAPLFHALSVLGPALAAAAIGFLFAGRELRRMTVLFPMLLAVTFIAGKFIEPRQFNAFLPIAAALIATAGARLGSEAVRS